MQRTKSDPTRALYGAAAVCAVAASVLTEVRDTDAWWHLAEGRHVLSSGFPSADPFSYTMDGPRAAYRWLSQVLFYLGWAAAGSAGVIFVKATVCAAAAGLLWTLGRARPVLAAFTVVAGVLVAREWLVVRPVVFDLMMIALLIKETRKRAPSWVLPALAALWANLHGGAAFLGAVIVSARCLEEANRAAWFKSAALCALAVLVTPEHVHAVVAFFEALTFPALGLIQEWRPPWRLLPLPLGPWLALAGVSTWVVRREDRVSAAWAALGLLLMLRAERGTPIGVALSLPAVLSATARLPKVRIPAAVVVTLIGCLVWVDGAVLRPRFSERAGLGMKLATEGAAEFVKKEGLTGRMFNEYDSGGELMFLLPGRRVFVDSRGIEYGESHFRSSLRWYIPDEWAGLDKVWRSDYAIIRRHPSGAYTTRVLDALPEWRLMYWDDTAMVYARLDGANATAAAQRGLKLLQPGRSNAQYIEAHVQGGRGQALLEELSVSLERAPKNLNAVLLAAYVEARSGRLGAAEQWARKGVSIHPDRAQPFATLGWTLMAAGDLVGAETAYRSGLKVLRRSERPTVGADLLNNLGRVLEKRGDVEGAVRLYEEALGASPDHGDARHNLGRLRTL